MSEKPAPPSSAVPTPALPRGDDAPGQRLDDQVYARIFDAIRLGHYSLGEKLPSENELAAEHGVSRPVVRIALAKLREDGLIVSRQGAGSFVSSGEQKGSGYGPLDSIEDIGRFFEFRKFIEGEIAARAADRVAEGLAGKPRDGAGLRRLHENLDSTVTRIEAGTQTVETDFTFHTLVAELSDNRFLSDSLAMLRPHWFFVGKFVRSLSSAGYARTRPHMLDEHRRILAAIEAGDRVAARAAMVEHVAGSERRVFKGDAG